MAALSSHTSTYVSVQWSPLQTLWYFHALGLSHGSNWKFNVLSQKSPEKMLATMADRRRKVYYLE